MTLALWNRVFDCRCLTERDYGDWENAVYGHVVFHIFVVQHDKRIVHKHPFFSPASSCSLSLHSNCLIILICPPIFHLHAVQVCLAVDGSFSQGSCGRDCKSIHVQNGATCSSLMAKYFRNSPSVWSKCNPRFSCVDPIQGNRKAICAPIGAASWSDIVYIDWTHFVPSSFDT